MVVIHVTSKELILANNLRGCQRCLFIPPPLRGSPASCSSDFLEQTSVEAPQDLHPRDKVPLDLNSMPTDKCTVPPGVLRPYCLEQPPIFAPDCLLVPCPGNFSPDCRTYTLDCFCSQPSPLQCAWSCDRRGWMYMEDWFSKTCPNVPPVDFSALPSCARRCIETDSIVYGCAS